MEQRKQQEEAAPQPAARRRRPVEPAPVAPIIAVPAVHSVQMLYRQGHQEFLASLASVHAQEERRTMVGNFIYPFVQDILFNQLHLQQNQMLAGKVTGMIISL
jgi:hypothetical protein